MPRPTKWRRVAAVPTVVYFKPAGVPLRELSEVAVGVEEMEAIRLRDVQALDQEACARMMAISRPTFHRVLASARRKVADALTAGKALRIEGGNFAMAEQTVRCAAHGHEWRLRFEALASGRPPKCPICNGPPRSATGRWSRGRGGGQGGRRGRRVTTDAVSHQTSSSHHMKELRQELRSTTIGGH